MSTEPEPPTSYEPPAPVKRKRGLWPWVVGGWAVLLLGLGVWSSFNDPATIRDQSSVGSAKQTMDEVVGKLPGLVPAGWTVRDDGLRERGCELSIWRDGTWATRTLTLTGPEGSEVAALKAVARGLGGDDAVLRPGEGEPEAFYFDAGDFVAVRGQTEPPGEVKVELASGCRPKD